MAGSPKKERGYRVKPTDRQLLVTLGAYLAMMVFDLDTGNVTCDNSFRHTTLWLRNNGYNRGQIEEFLAWVQHHGAMCDCGVCLITLWLYVPDEAVSEIALTA